VEQFHYFWFGGTEVLRAAAATAIQIDSVALGSGSILEDAYGVGAASLNSGILIDGLSKCRDTFPNTGLPPQPNLQCNLAYPRRVELLVVALPRTKGRRFDRLPRFCHMAIGCSRAWLVTHRNPRGWPL
jgi:hypothetical protein